MALGPGWSEGVRRRRWPVVDVGALRRLPLIGWEPDQSRGSTTSTTYGKSISRRSSVSTFGTALSFQPRRL